MKHARFTHALIASMLAVMPCAASADDDGPEPTVVRYCSGPWTLGCQTGYQQAVITPSDTTDGATGISFETDVFRWLFYVSGPPACTFTASKDKSGKLVNVGGGRECNGNVSNCGFFVRGYTIYGVSGKACDGYGIERCSGWCN